MRPKKHLLARTMPDLKHVNSIVFRQPKIYAYWVSPNFFTPVSEGWYVHAAKVLAEGLDPAVQPNVHWQHSQVHGDGLTDLKLNDESSYAFYLTPENATAKELKRHHLSWHEQSTLVHLEDPAIIVCFAAQRIDFDRCGKTVAAAGTFDTTGTLDDLYAFNSSEHFLLGERAQKMVDDWARSGLVEGGAFLDTSDEALRFWSIRVPDSGDPSKPYRDLFPSDNMHWHYILAEPGVDVGRADTLQSALLEGRAAALSIGDILMLAGDYFGTFEDMHDPSKRDPVNVMDGVEQRDAFAGMILDVLTLSHSSMGELLPKARAHALGQKDWMSEVHHDEEKEQARFAKLNAVIDAVRDCLGTTRFSEIDILARSLKRGRPIPLRDLQGRAGLSPEKFSAMERTLINHLDESERESLNFPGLDTEFFSMVATNGHYAELALHNKAHFTADKPKDLCSQSNPGARYRSPNLAEFLKYYERALRMVREHATSTPRELKSAPIPAEAIALTAFGLHFLTDSFSSGHMRVPRESLGVNGSLAAKMMHDLDGGYGLQVTYGSHDKQEWRAFGDDYLSSLPADEAAQWIAQKNGRDSNEKRVMFAVLSAFRQLHLMAQWNGFHRGYGQVLDAATRLDKTLEGGWYEIEPLASGSVRTIEDAIDRFLEFMANLQPKPKDVGHELSQNHPPLYLEDGTLNTAAVGSKHKDGYYRDTSSAGNVMEIHLRWHKDKATGNVQEYVLDISKIYYLALYTQESKGHKHAWMHGGEQRLLGDYARLPNPAEEREAELRHYGIID